ncbi:hypothetical protein [Acaryochloris thomasi]|uniref:hypothetical protein n=1 Tax=Acaryochloris thomasi TaxID=2929456 RepID=UPI001314641D|nr:hypothetical protein [Acaryochloris thomasi]
MGRMLELADNRVASEGMGCSRLPSLMWGGDNWQGKVLFPLLRSQQRSEGSVG